MVSLRTVLADLQGFLHEDEEILEWRGPPGILSAADRGVLARARSEIVAALREGPLCSEVCSDEIPDQPDQRFGGPPESIAAGPYAGFLSSPADRKPDPLRAAVAVLEALAWRLKTHVRDAKRREEGVGAS